MQFKERHSKFAAALVATVIFFTFTSLSHAQTVTLLQSFNGTDGLKPEASMILDTAGNLYGTTFQGGPLNDGNVFELTRNSSGVWKEIVLHSFNDTRTGGFPVGALVQDAAGNLYGTTVYGGDLTDCQSFGCGVVFELSPTSTGNWRETVLHLFTGGADGAFPSSGLLLDAAGNLYGTTPFGGNNADCPGNNFPGCGVVFKLSPLAGGGWKETVLYSFTGATDGGTVAGGVVFDAADNLYGATQYYGSASNAGTIFELSPSLSGSWTETTLHAFTLAPDGAYPNGNLVLDASGNLYGMTYAGGDGGGSGSGTVFELSPASGGTWTENILHNFTGLADGGFPYDGVILDASGNLYGTTSISGPGSQKYGVAFELSPGTGGSWTENVLYTVPGGTGGSYPYGGVVLDGSGNLYGTTWTGGAHNKGTVFEITP